MKCESVQKPPKFSVVKDDDTAIIIFATNVEEVARTKAPSETPAKRQNKKHSAMVNVEASEEDATVVFAYDRYQLKVPYRDNLTQDIEAGYDSWLDKAIQQHLNDKAQEIREKRNALLDESDKEVTFDRLIEKYGTEVVTNPEKFKDLPIFKYRQALKDITLQATFPESVVFPEKP